MDDLGRVKEFDAFGQLIEDKPVMSVFKDLLTALLKTYPMAL